MAKYTRAQWLEQARKLDGYFERLLDEQGNVWALELWMVRGWQRLIRQPNPDEAEVLLFAQAVESHRNSGTAWMEVQYLVDKWFGEIELKSA